MGSGGLQWDANDTLTGPRLNQKTLYVDTTEPTTKYAGMLWYNTTSNILEVRNTLNTLWLLQFNQSLLTTDSPTFNSLSLSATTGLTIGGDCNIHREAATAILHFNCDVWMDYSLETKAGDIFVKNTNATLAIMGTGASSDAYLEFWVNGSIGWSIFQDTSLSSQLTFESGATNVMTLGTGGALTLIGTYAEFIIGTYNFDLTSNQQIYFGTGAAYETFLARVAAGELAIGGGVQGKTLDINYGAVASSVGTLKIYGRGAGSEFYNTIYTYTDENFVIDVGKDFLLDLDTNDGTTYFIIRDSGFNGVWKVNSDGVQTSYGDIYIVKASPILHVYANTSSDALIKFWDNSTEKMWFGYSGAADVMYWYDKSGTRDIMKLSHEGQLRVLLDGSNAGILIGSDTQLYRSAANVLYTPDSFQAASFVSSDGTAGTTDSVVLALEGITLNFKNGLFVGAT